MHEYNRYWEAVKDDPLKTAELVKISNEMHKKLKAYCPSAYYDMLTKMHCVVFGPHFDESTAKMAVARMHNVDETTGEHWSYEQIANLATQNNIKCVPDLYFTLNMLYSDYSKVLGSDVSTYLKMAKAYMSDPDGPEGKPFVMWIAKMRAEKDED